LTAAGGGDPSAGAIVVVDNGFPAACGIAGFAASVGVGAFFL
jgi:hypothetical protein